MKRIQDECGDGYHAACIAPELAKCDCSCHGDSAPERRCPTCESLDHRECDDETLRNEDATEEPGPDFTISNEGTLFIFNPLTPAARDWINEHIEEPTWWGNSLIVEHRYARPLGLGILQDGLEVRDA